ncbi:MAG: NAD-binding protein, partial [Desulfobacterales bacterium]|nr:NAD-binding protein [Desulfobacterales bacterium]
MFLIDEREENFKELDEDVDVLAITGNPIAVETLRKAGASEHTRLVAVTDSDDLNLMLLFLGERIGIKEGYALIKDLKYYQSFAPLINRSHGRLYLLNLWEIVIQKIEERNKIEVQLIFSDPDHKFSILAVKFLKSHNLVGK